MTLCECRQPQVFGFHLALSPSRGAATMESEVARIIAIIGHLPGALVKLSTVENALACALSGARQQDSTKSVYVCGGIDIEEELLLAITHQGKPCGSGKDGPVTCEANAWQAKVADWPVEQAPDRKSQIRTQWTTAPSVLADACASSITLARISTRSGGRRNLDWALDGRGICHDVVRN